VLSLNQRGLKLNSYQLIGFCYLIKYKNRFCLYSLLIPVIWIIISSGQKLAQNTKNYIIVRLNNLEKNNILEAIGRKKTLIGSFLPLND